MSFFSRMRATAIYRLIFLNIEHATADSIGRFFVKKNRRPYDLRRDVLMASPRGFEPPTYRLGGGC
ncbi:hypothetical protein, partial [uncultured Allobaculum sp.]|uniref:hypothetical protein n=1 Tax=uncultured Allobaculum sp. TaxID=1187017 RepID=UPI0025A59F82